MFFSLHTAWFPPTVMLAVVMWFKTLIKKITQIFTDTRVWSACIHLTWLWLIPWYLNVLPSTRWYMWLKRRRKITPLWPTCGFFNRLFSLVNHQRTFEWHFVIHTICLENYDFESDLLVSMNCGLISLHKQTRDFSLNFVENLFS